MDLSLQPYNYTVLKPDYYSFITESGDEYFCYFSSYADYFSDYPRIAPHIFSFNLELRKKRLKHKGIDKRIADTVITIVGHFLSGLINAVVYVCDSSDGKESVRSRKFISWFNFYHYEFSDILQINSNFKVGGMMLYTALLVHKKNKQMKEFVEAYIDFTEDNDK